MKQRRGEEDKPVPGEDEEDAHNNSGPTVQSRKS